MCKKITPTDTQIKHWLAMAEEAMHSPATPIKEHGHAYAAWVLAQECLEHRASKSTNS